MRARGTAVRSALLLLAAGGAVWGLLGLQASPEEVKAAFLYQFTRFVEWPGGAFAGPSDPWRVGVLGDDTLGEALDRALADKRVGGRAFRVERSARPADLRGCHIVFVPEGESARLAEVVRSLKGASTLVVGEFPGAAGKGASMNFIVENRKVRLEVNPAAAGAAGLKVSSKLLQLARVVKP